MGSRATVLSLLSVLAALAPALVLLLVAGPGHAGSQRCFGKEATIVADGGLVEGTSGADVIVATDPGTEVHARGGSDRVCGAFLVYGGGGDDRIIFGVRSTDDVDLSGGRGDDRVFATGGQYGYVHGGSGADRLVSRSDEQWIDGGTGSDTLSGGDGEDHLVGGPGDDLVQGDGGNDQLSGHGGDDRLRGGGGDDVLTGSGGRDAGFGGPGRDTCDDGIERKVSCR